jgi:hypothetical protein
VSGELEIACSTMVEGNQEWDWLQARTAYVPGEESFSVTLMNQTRRRFTHDYCDIYQTTSRDGGDSWSDPSPVPSLRRATTADGYEVAPSDLWTQWHPKSGMVIAAGVSFHFAAGQHEHHLRQQAAYAVMDPKVASWGPLQALELPELDHENLPMLAQSAGCSQRVDLIDGDVLLPLRYLASSNLDKEADTFDYGDESVVYKSIVARCSFDGRKLIYKEHGSEHSITREHSRQLAARRGVEFSARGLYEPSLAAFDGSFFLTLRSDHSAFVTKGQDGIIFDDVREWSFDDGEVLGSYCTQQHWAVIGGTLYLLYNRPSGANDHVFRHRAPIFIGAVDPDSLHVVRATERVAVAENSAAMGNFGICQVSENESWVTVGEGMRTGARNGDTNKVILAKIVAPGPGKAL